MTASTMCELISPKGSLSGIRPVIVHSYMQVISSNVDNMMMLLALWSSVNHPTLSPQSRNFATPEEQSMNRSCSVLSCLKKHVLCTVRFIIQSCTATCILQFYKALICGSA